MITDWNYFILTSRLKNEKYNDACNICLRSLLWLVCFLWVINSSRKLICNKVNPITSSLQNRLCTLCGPVYCFVVRVCFLFLMSISPVLVKTLAKRAFPAFKTGNILENGSWGNGVRFAKVLERSFTPLEIHFLASQNVIMQDEARYLKRWDCLCWCYGLLRKLSLCLNN